MIGPGLIALVAAAVLATSFLSGIFGMAGGIILLGLLLLFLDVAPAMVVFGATQMASNGWRGVLWRKFVRWDIVLGYVGGALVTFTLMRLISIVPSKPLVYLLLGLMPFALHFLPDRFAPDITKRGMAFVCGLIILVPQLLAGAAGATLDIFFNRSALDRKSIVATKAVSQLVAHSLRIAYFGSYAGAFDPRIPWYAYLGMMALAIAGTSFAAGVLHKMTDVGFKLWSKRLIMAVSATYIARGLWMLAQG